MGDQYWIVWIMIGFGFLYLGLFYVALEVRRSAARVTDAIERLGGRLETRERSTG